MIRMAATGYHLKPHEVFENNVDSSWYSYSRSTRFVILIQQYVVVPVFVYCCWPRGIYRYSSSHGRTDQITP